MKVSEKGKVLLRSCSLAPSVSELGLDPTRREARPDFGNTALTCPSAKNVMFPQEIWYREVTGAPKACVLIKGLGQESE